MRHLALIGVGIFAAGFTAVGGFLNTTNAFREKAQLTELCSSITGNQCEDLKNTVNYGIDRNLLTSSDGGKTNATIIYNELAKKLRAGATYEQVKTGLVKTMQEKAARLRY